MRSILLLLFACGHCAYCQTWNQIPDFPGTARDDAAAFSIGPHAYFGTGMQVGWSLTNDWWMLDIIGNPQWYSVPQLPASPRQYCTAFNFDFDTEGYLFGGLDANGALNELWSFSESTNSWTQKASLPAAGRYAAASFTLNSKAYVVTGLVAGGHTTNECWRYDPLTDDWLQVADIPGIGRHRASCINSWPYGYVAGGADSAYHALSDVWRYDANNDEWTAAQPLPEARYGADAIAADWLPGIIGGASNDTTFHSNAYMYSESDGWTDLGPVIPNGLRGGAGTYASVWAGWNASVYGTGLDSSFTRHREMYMTVFAFNIEEFGLSAVYVHPNPGTSRVVIEMPHVGPLDVLITDAQGRSVLMERFIGRPEIDASNWKSGLYLVHATSEEGHTCRTRWIKQ
ncbi:MAG: T9SS type A sorting domain-containing protein [Flavobacteriales bacterium]|nr:T9SS type A sorting domain-containing protein [Flavobacteriales bacterium]